jgi:maltose/moltooligosaccharide transporter
LGQITAQPTQGFWQLWNMNVGYLGIQFGWTLQMANTSAIYEYLGANPEQIPLLWLAAPMSGLITQPIIGYLSDRTRTRWGRRRPYFLGGAIISSIALVLMPNSSSLWMAALLLWMMDTAVNVSMQPYRAFIVDILPKKQIDRGFAMQGFFIGLGSVVAAIAPWVLSHVLGGVSNEAGSIPLTVKLSFYLGAIIFLVTVLWTVITTPEPDLGGENEPKPAIIDANLKLRVKKMVTSMVKLPYAIEQLALVQFFTWLGIFCIFLCFPAAIAHNIFGASEQSSPLYTMGIEWAGFCIAAYNLVCFLVSGILPKLSESIGRKFVHSLCLLSGGIAMVSLLFIRDRYLILLPTVVFGFAWASILSIPYAIVSDRVPSKQMGLYMGIFNIFVVIPQIVVSLGLGWVMVNYFDNNFLFAVVLGGVFLIIAALLAPSIDDSVTEV